MRMLSLEPPPAAGTRASARFPSTPPASERPNVFHRMGRCLPPWDPKEISRSSAKRARMWFINVRFIQAANSLFKKRLRLSGAGAGGASTGAALPVIGSRRSVGSRCGWHIFGRARCLRDRENSREFKQVLCLARQIRRSYCGNQWESLFIDKELTDMVISRKSTAAMTLSKVKYTQHFLCPWLLTNSAPKEANTMLIKKSNYHTPQLNVINRKLYRKPRSHQVHCRARERPVLLPLRKVNVRQLNTKAAGKSCFLEQSRSKEWWKFGDHITRLTRCASLPDRRVQTGRASAMPVGGSSALALAPSTDDIQLCVMFAHYLRKMFIRPVTGSFKHEYIWGSWEAHPSQEIHSVDDFAPGGRSTLLRMCSSSIDKAHTHPGPNIRARIPLGMPEAAAPPKKNPMGYPRVPCLWVVPKQKFFRLPMITHPMIKWESLKIQHMYVL